MKKTIAMPFFPILPAGGRKLLLKGTISDNDARRNLGSVRPSPANPFLMNTGLPDSEKSKINHNNRLYHGSKGPAGNAEPGKGHLVYNDMTVHITPDFFLCGFSNLRAVRRS
jgi:hypothetical protein